jgi:hypothetical protein
MPQEANQFLSQYLSAFPDAQTTVEDLLADGAKVVARVSIRATHRGAFRGIAPTGKPITVMGINIFRVANGKLVWGRCDSSRDDEASTNLLYGGLRRWHILSKYLSGTPGEVLSVRPWFTASSGSTTDNLMRRLTGLPEHCNGKGLARVSASA